MKFNTTDNQYQGNDPAMQAAQALGNHLRKKYDMRLNDRLQDMEQSGPVWERIYESDRVLLNEIIVWSDWNGAPAVTWEGGSDYEWAFAISSFDWFAQNGHEGYYFEPYYSFAVNIYEA